ncbi:hypothetical protein ApAK_04100 [Thermoplasmatales archaeon AK]|nr:hypothetical protein [Thermoplasmatales archaeon AK]
MADLKELGYTLKDRLVRNGFWVSPGPVTVQPVEYELNYGGGYPITGIEKFLGYFDPVVNIANFPSISVAANYSSAHCYCRYLKKPGNDLVILDGKKQDSYTRRANKALSFFKSLFSLTGSFQFYVERKKRYESAKGLGESAAVAASCARALYRTISFEDPSRNLPLVSRLARLVSGSGTRSVSGGVSLWLSFPYIHEPESYAVRVSDGDKIAIGFIPFKSGATTENMHILASESPYYQAWVSMKFNRILDLLDRKFPDDLMMRIAESDMFLMHSLLLSRGIYLHTPESLSALEKMISARKKVGEFFFTADTGPSIVVFSSDEHTLKDLSEEIGHRIIGAKVVKDEPEEDMAIRKRAEEALESHGS